MNVGSTNRITGLFSGLDTDALVKNMLSTQQSRVDKVFQQKEKATWKYEAYASINNTVSTFKNKYFSVLSSDNLMSSKPFNAFKTNVTGKAVSITGSTNPMLGSFDILSTKRATAAMAIGNTSSKTKVQRFDTLRTMAQKLGTVVGDVLNVDIQGKAFTFSPDQTTVQDFIQDINEGQDQITISFSEMTNTFTISSNASGSSSTLDFSGLEAFGLSTENIRAGSDAEMTVSINGVTSTVTQNSNEFEYDGLKFKIVDDYQGQEPIEVTVEKDNDDTVNKVKSFINDYNELIKNLNTQYNAEKYREYTPLTDAQRAEMSEKDQALWDEKAKSGILKNDSYLGNLISNLRTEITKKVGDLSSNDLGISTKPWSSESWKTDSGQLILDEEKLREALDKDSEAVQSFFTESESGLLTRLNEHLINFNTQMRKQGMVNVQNNITSYSKDMDSLMNKLYQKQEEYYNQFSKLESMMANMQAQSNWFYSQLGMN